MAASGRYARGSVLTALNLINLSSHTVATAHGTDFITRESNRRDRKTGQIAPSSRIGGLKKE